ncbi:MAG: hypothetical protein ACI39H_03080 [Lachnospiraceae bacterium]
MRQVVEGMVAMMFVILLCLTGMELLSAHIDAGMAKDYRNQVVCALLNSDYDLAVINENLEEARKNGYELSIRLYLEDGTSEESSEEFLSVPAPVEMAKVSLKYKISIPVLHKEATHIITATVG